MDFVAIIDRKLRVPTNNSKKGGLGLGSKNGCAVGLVSY
jgi:hypothetical protein